MILRDIHSVVEINLQNKQKEIVMYYSAASKKYVMKYNETKLSRTWM